MADGVAYVLPEMGHFQQENAVVIPTPDNSKTYLAIPEDKGVNDSQLALYVGTKQPDDPNPMIRNGLVGGDPLRIPRRRSADHQRESIRWATAPCRASGC